MNIDSFLTGKRGVSLPFTDSCEPIASNVEQFQEMFAAAVTYGKQQNWKTMEIRGGEAFLQDKEPSEWHYGHTLDLGNRGAVPLFLRDSTRRNIKKAEKEGVTITVSDAPDAMEKFRHLNAMTRKDHGLPPQPRRFFQVVHDRIIAKDMGFIVLASYRGNAIAANVYFCFGDQVIYKYGASNRTHQRLRASNLVMWEAIKWICDKGYKTLYFGRTEPENNGLRQYKSGWGASEMLIKYYQYDLRTDAFIRAHDVVSPLYKKLFSKLPIPALNILGNILYRHMG
jgi:lipid II:glycine glycyltransferase (peptidoglycan interpeptide bridge formation enzyme)